VSSDDAASTTDTTPSTAARAAVPARLQKLLAEPKGKLSYRAGEAFLLHVFWETPSAAAADQLLDALARCAAATRRDTPATPTYFFRRVVTDDSEDGTEEGTPSVYGDTPRRVSQHAHLAQAIKRMRVGMPAGAVASELRRRGLTDPSLLHLSLEDALPASLQLRPVGVECTEVYLDERAFMEHVGSRDYLDSYGAVMNPALMNAQNTLRLGTPPQKLVDTILDPSLKCTEASTHEQGVWRLGAAKAMALRSAAAAAAAAAPDSSSVAAPAAAAAADDLQSLRYAVLLSLDVANAAADDDAAAAATAAAVSASLPASFLAGCTSCVSFLHARRPRTTRLLVIWGQQGATPTAERLAPLAALRPLRGEAHLQLMEQQPPPQQPPVAAGSSTNQPPSAVACGAAAVAALKSALSAAGLSHVLVNGSRSVGYVLHERAPDLRVEG